MVAETAGWLDFITAPLAAEVRRLKGAAGDLQLLKADLDRAARVAQFAGICHRLIERRPIAA